MTSRYTLAAFLGLFIACQASAIELKYRFSPGKIYEYEHTTKRSSRHAAIKMTGSQPETVVKQKFTLRAIDFQKGVNIVDVVSETKTLRRYIRENGTLAGAPAETGEAIPFLLTFPTGDWKVAQRHQIDKSLTLGDITLPTSWNLLLNSVDTEKQTAEILFSLSVRLPEDRTRRKALTLKGKALFDYGEGLLRQADWVSNYRFAFSNREMAIERDLWWFEHQASGTLKLISARE